MTSEIRGDAFEDLARHYDALMRHVDYERWFLTTTALARLLRPGFVHLDAACGTGTLLKQLVLIGWESYGMDLSAAMTRAARRSGTLLPLAVGDLRAQPFAPVFDLVTCLFDSLNFVLKESDVRAAISEFARILRPEGVLYFDVVTERMVTEHFEGEKWTERHKGFEATWESVYDRKTRIADSTIRINTGSSTTIRERIYDRELIESALKDAGLTLLEVLDAETWRAPTHKSIRLEFIAVKNPSADQRKSLRLAQEEVRQFLV